MEGLKFQKKLLKTLFDKGRKRVIHLGVPVPDGHERILHASYMGQEGHRYILYDEWCMKHLKKASCTTVNSYQGLETETIIYVIPYDSKHETRERLYTVVTRARSRVILIVPSSNSLSKIVNQREPKYRTKLDMLVIDRISQLI